MSVRAKFKCCSVVKNDEHATIRLDAVTNGSEENKEFFKYTPSGSLALYCVNAAASEQFVEGAEYYLDITKVD